MLRVPVWKLFDSYVRVQCKPPQQQHEKMEFAFKYWRENAISLMWLGVCLASDYLWLIRCQEALVLSTCSVTSFFRVPPPPFLNPLTSQKCPCLYGDGRGQESLIIHEKKRERQGGQKRKKAMSVLVFVSNLTLIYLQDNVSSSCGDVTCLSYFM